MNALVVRITLLLFVLCPAGAFAQSTTKPATQPAPASVYDKKPLQRSAPTSTSPTANKPVAVPSTGMDTGRVILALALVIVVIFLLRWIAQQFFGAPVAKKSSQAVQVLSRSLVSPKQQVLLLQVGKRVIVVGDSGGQMSALSQITDPDEIASLIAQLKHDKTDPVTRAFSSVFGKAQREFDPPESEAKSDSDMDPALATTQAELSGLMDKVRSVARSMQKP